MHELAILGVRSGGNGAGTWDPTIMKALLDNIPDWGYWIAPDGVHRYVSSGCEKISGYSPDAFRADRDLFERLVHPQDRPRLDRYRERMAQSSEASGPEESIEIRLVARDGSERWIEHRCRPMRDSAGVYIGQLAINRDIQSRKSIEQALERTQKMFEALGQLNQTLLRASHESMLYEGFCRSVVDTGGLRGCAIWMPGPYGFLRLAASAGLDSDLAHSMPAPPQAGPYPGATELARRDWECSFADWARAAGMDFWLHYPVERAGRLAGLACYFGVGAQAPGLTDLLKDLTADLSFGLAHLDRRAADSAARAVLAQGDAQYRALLRAVPVGIGMVRDRVHLLEVNERLCEMVGYSREELIGQSIGMLFPDDEKARLAPEGICGSLPREGFAEVDLRLRRRDGQLIDVVLSGVPLDRADSSRGMVAAVMDVTRIRRDQALLEARLKLAQIASTGDLEALLRAGLEVAQRLTQSAISFVQLMPDGDHPTVQQWSRSVPAAGCDAVESGSRVLASVADLCGDALRLGKPVIANDNPGLNPAESSDASFFPTRKLVVPVVQGDRTLAVVAVGNKEADYSDENRDTLVHVASMILSAVESLRAQESLRQHARVFESTSEGVIITDAQGHIQAVNQSFLSITGYSETEVIGETPRILASGRHDRNFYEHLWAELLATGQWRGEIWNRRKNGDIYPEWLTISAVTDPSGQTTHYVAVFSDISHIKRAQERLDFLAHHDALTGLPNRALLQDRLQHAIARAHRQDRRLALMFLDLDGFKGVNDTLGHAVGDRLLEVVAERLTRRLRASDTLARLGGDEFLILLEEDTDTAAAAAVADSCLRLLAQAIHIRGHEIFISGSIGIAVFPTDGNDSETLLASADLAMYRAKAEGRNTYQFYVSEMSEAALERRSLEDALRGALARNEISLHYQAQTDLVDGHLVGVEALARWTHPRLGIVPPTRFIPIAESIGMVAEIDEWVLAQACGQLAAWRACGFSVPRISVNCSRQPLERGTLVPAVRSALESGGLTPGDLELEVTEGVVMGKSPRALAALAELGTLGVRLAIDNFGTGYSALGRLKRVPVDRIKIDTSFIRDIGRDPKDEAVARALVGLGNDLGLEVVAEGVERSDQVELLLREGCGVGQGYLFGVPMEAVAFEAAWSGHPRLGVTGAA